MVVNVVELGFTVRGMPGRNMLPVIVVRKAVSPKRTLGVRYSDIENSAGLENTQ
jgi:hypothetical protein